MDAINRFSERSSSLLWSYATANCRWVHTWMIAMAQKITNYSTFFCVAHQLIRFDSLPLLLCFDLTHTTTTKSKRVINRRNHNKGTAMADLSAHVNCYRKECRSMLECCRTERKKNNKIWESSSRMKRVNNQQAASIDWFVIVIANPPFIQPIIAVTPKNNTQAWSDPRIHTKS